MKDIFNIKIGADPEIFIVNADDGEITSASNITEGTKYNPEVICKGFSIHRDNILLEYNIPPAGNEEEFVDNNLFALDCIRELAGSKGYDIKISPAEYITEDLMFTREAREIGCAPEYCIWKTKRKAISRFNDNLRTAGGHIHISAKNMTLRDCINLVKVIELYVTLPLSTIEWRKEKLRRKYYGRSGSCRFRKHDDKYILEVRSISNIWLSNTELIKWLYNSVMKAINVYCKYTDTIMKSIDENEYKLIQAVNGNYKYAKEIISLFDIDVPKIHKKVIL